VTAARPAGRRMGTTRRCGRCLAIAVAHAGPRPATAGRPLGGPQLPRRSHSGRRVWGKRSRDSGRQRVTQNFTYSGFPGCRGARQPGCSAHDSASFAHGPVSTTCSRARNTGRSLAPHILFHAPGIAAFPSSQHGHSNLSDTLYSRETSVQARQHRLFFREYGEDGVSGR
jgi:hypothetical protein